MYKQALFNGVNPNFPMFASISDDDTLGIMLPYEFVSNMDIHTNCPSHMRSNFFNRKNTFKVDVPENLGMNIYNEICRIVGRKSENGVWSLITSFTTPSIAHDYCKSLGLKGDIEWYTALTLYKMAHYINAPKECYKPDDERNIIFN